MKKNRSNNRMSSASYWLEILFLTIVLGIMFYFWGFKNCLFMDRTISTVFLLIFDVAAVLALGLINVKNNRNNFSVWATVILPLEIYCVLSYITLKAWRIFVLLVIWILLVFTWLLITTYKSLKRGEEFRLDMVAMPKLIRAGWLLAVVVYLGFIIPIMGLGARGIEVALDYTIVANETKGFSITGQQTNLVKLDDSIWKKLDRNKKEELLQLVADIESSELGLPYNLYIGIRSFGENEGSSAYVAGDHKILLAEKAVQEASGEELIAMICHQAYHAYERSIVDLYMNTERAYQKLSAFGNVEQYVAELQKNVQALDDRLGEKSILETDAEKYETEKTEEYLYWINFALESGK